ncbi:hypothetical protein AXYL_04699 [Achromobacter xylosoxidans A8]|uniref:Uncharacterized protein n=1 Tax=Achromobacter xylosoxidans (strain A8) TaxID=762376 RepID=E3HJB3_ACHXA|nr:hypothetical protein [Achromobacter xylosoxidans]ADP18013.1 hypothetical protein AXYL_04699 [Achromobacter xylosoxidans A8]
MDKFERETTAPSIEILSEGELRARRTLEAARRLLDPHAEPAAATVSPVEAELQRYVKEAYRRRSYTYG